jgi:hypothetical protein
MSKLSTQFRVLNNSITMSDPTVEKCQEWAEKISWLCQELAEKAEELEKRSLFIIETAIKTALADVIKAESIGKWMDTPNPAFGNKKPSSLIACGREQELWDMVFELSSGMPR